MKHFLTVLCVALGAGGPMAQEAGAQEFAPHYKYRVQLRDKKGTPYSVKRPEQFLSRKSIARRQRQRLKIDKTDLPVTPSYVEAIAGTGASVLLASKWNNTVLVQVEDTTLMERVAQLPCVGGVRKVAAYLSPTPPSRRDRFALIPTAGPEPGLKEAGQDEECSQPAQEEQPVRAPFHGAGDEQIRQLGGTALHERGYRGKGMTIAVIDGGFYNADTIPMLRGARILGTKDFVAPGGNVYEEQSHGMMVLSCMAANTPHVFVGTAPEASYWLLRSEDANSEQLVEEDYWAAAAEFADSVGADIINTSLGYSKFDNPADCVKYHELDGHARLVSNTASMIASKGIVLCNSAGNEGNKTWKLISCPADADDVLTVGAVDSTGKNTLFSSIGHSADGRIKPDVMARGGDATVLDITGAVSFANGTSFASPILCGMVACYWQAHPELTAIEVVRAVRQLGDNTAHPDNVFGYGIPDFGK